MFSFSNPSIQYALPEIAEHFFCEVKQYGLFHLNQKLDKQQFALYIKTRLAFITFFFEILEKNAGLNFSSDSHIPFIYNLISSKWNDNFPIAGYTENNSIKPSHVINTMMACWSQNLTLDSSASRLLRAALWVINKSDFDTAVIYLIDLLKNGFIIQTKDLITTLSALFKAKNLVMKDCDIIELFLGKTSGEDIITWKQSDLDMRWIDKEIHSVSSENEKSFEILFEQTLIEIENTRSARSWDEWIINKKLSDTLLHTMVVVSKPFRHMLSINVLSILSQMEEIVADSFGEIALHSIFGNDFEPYKSNFSFEKNISLGFKMTFGESYQDKMYQERIMLPEEIYKQVLQEKEIELPIEWKYFSWKVINPYSYTYMPGEQEPLIQFARAQLFNTDIILEDYDIQNLFNNFKIEDREIQKAILEKEYCGKIPSILKSGISLPEYPREELIKTLYKVIDKMSYEEIDSILANEEILRMQRKFDNVFPILLSLQKLYPWSSLVFHELAVAYDESGDSKKALQYIIPAVILNPQTYHEWKSLGIILQRIGAREEWNFVYALRMYLEERDL